jgi:hypothetical protein
MIFVSIGIKKHMMRDVVDAKPQKRSLKVAESGNGNIGIPVSEVISSSCEDIIMG